MAAPDALTLNKVLIFFYIVLKNQQPMADGDPKHLSVNMSQVRFIASASSYNTKLKIRWETKHEFSIYAMCTLYAIKAVTKDLFIPCQHVSFQIYLGVVKLANV